MKYFLHLEYTLKTVIRLQHLDPDRFVLQSSHILVDPDGCIGWSELLQFTHKILGYCVKSESSDRATALRCTWTAWLFRGFAIDIDVYS